MRVSVVICTYSLELYTHLQDAIDSVRHQTYDDIELIVVVDGNEQLCDRVEAEYGDVTGVKIHCNKQNRGLSTSRNNALEYATGDAIAFLDDDAVADERWIEELVSVYETEGAIAVGGKMTADWVAGKPPFLPAEFYWLVGVTHKGFANAGEEVRNTFGSNISFRREVFDVVGGFDPELGRRGSLNTQSEETIFCVQMRQHCGHGVVYNPDAVVAHKIFDYRTEPDWLLARAFWQGYSKRMMDQLIEQGGGDEMAFLKQLLSESIPNRARSLIQSPNVLEAMQLLSIVAFTVAVGFGYGYGIAKELLSYQGTNGIQLFRQL